jgi:hypothetical protein
MLLKKICGIAAFGAAVAMSSTASAQMMYRQAPPPIVRPAVRPMPQPMPGPVFRPYPVFVPAPPVYYPPPPVYYPPPPMYYPPPPPTSNGNGFQTFVDGLGNLVTIAVGAATLF